MEDEKDSSEFFDFDGDGKLFFFHSPAISSGRPVPLSLPGRSLFITRKMEIADRDDLMRNAGKKPVKRTGDVLSREAQDIGPSSVPVVLLGDLRSLIESARIRVAVGVNAELVMLHWHIGHRLREDIQNFGKSVYGEKLSDW